ISIYLFLLQHITSLYISFFFASSAAHRDLHSFPTRRSSDLHGAVRRRDDTFGRHLRRGQSHQDRHSRPDAVRGQYLHWFGDRQRSEEHTSELQSRENLVCRLLLEKKKNKIKK